jgi:hypothetical protein
MGEFWAAVAARLPAIFAARTGALDSMNASPCPTFGGRVLQLADHVIRNVPSTLAEAPDVVTALTTTE